MVKQYLHAFNAQHNVLQGVGLITQLGVLGARVYNDHIIGRNVQHFTLDIELTAPVHTVKHLRAGVCVRNRVPISAEAAFADIHQPDRLARRYIHIELVPCIHRKPPFSNYDKMVKI